MIQCKPRVRFGKQDSKVREYTPLPIHSDELHYTPSMEDDELREAWLEMTAAWNTRCVCRSIAVPECFHRLFARALR